MGAPQRKQYSRQILTVAKNIFSSGTYESDALNRTLIAVGTILLLDDTKDIASELNILQVIRGLNDLKGSGPVVVEEIFSVME